MSKPTDQELYDFVKGHYAPLYCDDCGDKLAKGSENWVSKLPANIASANAGESAVLCKKCFDKVTTKESVDDAVNSVAKVKDTDIKALKNFLAFHYNFKALAGLVLSAAILFAACFFYGQER